MPRISYVHFSLPISSFILSACHFSPLLHFQFFLLFLLHPRVADLKPLSVEVGEASTLRLLGAEQENAELRRRLEELQALQEVRAQGSKVTAVEIHNNLSQW